MFTMAGRRGERRREITWDEGKLSGDPYLVAILKAEAAAREGLEIGPPAGPHTTTNHLQSGLSTIELCRPLVEPGSFTTAGQVPALPPIPDGAIR